MGFLSRLLVPRGVRRAMHPVRTARSAVTPRSVKKVRRALSPVDSAKYGIERSVVTSLRSGSRKSARGSAIYQHGSCPTRHRTAEAAARCKNP